MIYCVKQFIQTMIFVNILFIIIECHRGKFTEDTQDAQDGQILPNQFNFRYHKGKKKLKQLNPVPDINSINKLDDEMQIKLNYDALWTKRPNKFDNIVPRLIREVWIDVNVSEVVSKLPHFWESTGFCPPDPHKDACEWLTSQDMIQNLAYIGAVPNNGIKNVRVHFLLDTVTIESLTDGKPVFNFTCLDQFIWSLYRNGLYPGFEIMGNPSGLFTDFENRTQIYMWRDLVHELASHYIDIYGLAYVMKWNFESWNEPKVKIFDGLNFTFQGFLNYYDASSEGLRLASSHLKFGGPSGGCKNVYTIKNFCWVLLDHLNNGTNYFTGLQNTRVDYISIHEKGEGPNNTEVMLEKEQIFHALLNKHQPKLIQVPVYNDEADPLVTWSKNLIWRANGIYSSMVAKVVTRHQNKYVANKTSQLKFQLLSNDNGFLSYQPLPFHQRTLLARFQVNATAEPYVHFISKPVYSVMGLLSLLGEDQIKTTSSHPYVESNVVNVMSTIHKPTDSIQDSWQMAALMYYSTDTDMEDRGYENKLSITFNISDFLVERNYSSDLLYVMYRLDDQHGNPYQVWKSNGSPATPSWKLFELMRDNQVPVRTSGPIILPIGTKSSVFSLNYTLPRFGLMLLHICARAQLPPDQVSELTVYNITFDQVLIVWSDSCVNTKCLLRYDIEFSSSGDNSTYQKINKMDSTFTIFVYSPSSKDNNQESTRGYYRVRAVDYWSRNGEYSLPAHYN